VWKVGANPVKPKEAIAFFRSKVPIVKHEWDDLEEDARSQAFTVSNAAHLDMVHDVWEAIDRALDEGSTYEEFAEAVGDSLFSAWGASDATRLETIFRTNVQSAYSAGRYAAMTDPDVLEVRPVWMFDAVTDSRTSDICDDCDGTILPAHDAWWATHQPPLHHQCRSQVITLTQEQADKRGGSTPRPYASADAGFGKVPSLNDWAPKRSDYPAELWAAHNDLDDGD
jgi:SPP1 gp7 family putative phage head morphogenesis protein